MDPALKTVLLSLFTGIVLATVGFAYGRIGASRSRKSEETLKKEAIAIEAVKERDKKIGKLEDDVKELKYKADQQALAAIPIAAAMEAMLIHKLTNDHTPEADALLKKVTDKTLTVDDAVEFRKAMKERTTDPTVSEAQQIAADILPGVTRLREIAEAEEATSKVKTVMVTVPETETVAAQDGGTQEQEKGN